MKSDVLIDDELHRQICRAFNKLHRDQAQSPDWHPGTDQKVQNLVDPSMYPLVLGQTRGFKDEVVGIQDAIHTWSGKGEIIPEERLIKKPHIWWPISYWSDKYQWLPTNVAFEEDGSVKLTSYINNLHPGRYSEIYRTVEKLVEKALPMWDQCLFARAQQPSRFDQPQNARYVRAYG